MSTEFQSRDTASETEVKTEIQDAPFWTKGDFTLISSDKYRFKVPSRLLFSASSVLRNAPTGGDKVVQFTDDKLETKDVLDDFLKLITNCDLEEVNESGHACTEEITAHTMNHYVNLILFMQKYDCSGALRAFAHQVLVLLVHDQISVSNTYSLGAIADDVQLCAAAVYLYTKQHSGQPVKMDVPARVWRLADTRYLYALRSAEHGGEITAEHFLDALMEWDNAPQEDVIFSDRTFRRHF